jgi:uncharacterized protein YndB with AHSA1/START domain
MFTAVATIMIAAPAHAVWDALTDPKIIKEYLFGTDVTSEWKVGGQIMYRGKWDGRSFEDKGIITNMIPNQLLEIAYWSSISGLPDTPENYKKISYRLMPEDLGTQVIVTDENHSTEAERDRVANNWREVLGNLKRIVEK